MYIYHIYTSNEVHGCLFKTMNKKIIIYLIMLLYFYIIHDDGRKLFIIFVRNERDFFITNIKLTSPNDIYI